MQTPYASRLKPPSPRKTNITHTPYTGSCTPHTLARRTRARRIVHIHSAERHTLRRHGPPWSSCVGLRANPVVSYSTSASLSLRVRSPALTCPLSSPRFRHHTTRCTHCLPYSHDAARGQQYGRGHLSYANHTLCAPRSACLSCDAHSYRHHISK